MDPIEDLRTYLEGLRDGEAPDCDTVEDLLSRCWTRFSGSNATNMRPEKLSGRLEEIDWQPPVLAFMIIRHGAASRGSKRGERHRWVVDLSDSTAHCEEVGHRQLRPNAPSVDVAPLADMLAHAVIEREQHGWLDLK